MAWPTNTKSSSTETASGTSGTHSWNHTVGASENLLIVLLHYGSAAAGNIFSGVTYNGVAMTLVNHAVDGTGTFEHVVAYKLASPSTGTNSIACSWSDANGPHMWGCAISYEGASSTLGAVTTNTGASANGSVTVADTASGDQVIAQFSSDCGSEGLTSEANTVIGELEDAGGGDSDFNSQLKSATGANTVMSWTSVAPSGGGWIAQGFAVKQASAGTDVALSGSASTSGSGTQAPGTSVPL